MGTTFAGRQLRALAVVVLALTAGIVALFTTAQSANAQTICGVTIVTPGSSPYPPAQAYITLSKSVVQPGETIKVTGGNFKPGEQIKYCMTPGGISLGATTADANGNVSADLTIPSDVADGTYTVFAVGTIDTVYDSASLTVKSATEIPGNNGGGKNNGGGLPFTGVQIAGLLLLALLALAAGTHLTRKARRQHTTV